jgi:hypothetical protein
MRAFGSGALVTSISSGAMRPPAPGSQSVTRRLSCGAGAAAGGAAATAGGAVASARVAGRRGGVARKRKYAATRTSAAKTMTTPAQRRVNAPLR